MMIPLQNYYRGNLLRYDVKLINQDTGVVDNSATDPNNGFIKVNEPVIKTYTVDIDQRDNQQSLQQTSLIYTNKMDGRKYFIFIDFQMTLHIYDITDHTNDQMPVIEISMKDVYNEAVNMFSKEKLCNNLVQLDEQILMMLCLGPQFDSDSSNDAASIVRIEIGDLKDVKVFTTKSQFKFNQMKQSTIIPIQKVESEYMILVKQKRLSCFLEIYKIFSYQQPELLRVIDTFIKNEGDSDEQVEKQNFRKLELGTPVCPSEFSPRITNDSIDGYNIKIESLQIFDIALVARPQQILIASDIEFGLLLMKIDCQNVEKCTYKPLSFYKQKGMTKLTVPNLNYFDSSLIYAQVTTPPQVVEINIQNLDRISLNRRYIIMADQSQYINLNILTANEFYIVSQLYSSKLSKPVFRVITRESQNFNQGHAEFVMMDFVDQSTSLNFIDSGTNYLLMKNNDYFCLLKILPQMLEIKNQALDSCYQNANYMIELTVSDSNVIYHKQKIPIEFFVESSTEQTLLSHFDNNDQNKVFEYSYYYNCGSNKFVKQITNFFEGPKSNMTLNYVPENDQDSDQNIMSITKYSLVSQNLIKIGIDECSMSEIIENRSTKNKITFLQCIKYKGNYIAYQEIQDNNSNQEKPEIKITLGPTVQIMDYNYDKSNNQLMVLSNEEQSNGALAPQISIFFMYNKLDWAQTVVLNDYLNLVFNSANFNFKYREKNIIYQNQQSFGYIISEKYKNDSKNWYQDIIIYRIISPKNLKEIENYSYQDFSQIFKIELYHTFDLDQNDEILYVFSDSNKQLSINFIQKGLKMFQIQQNINYKSDQQRTTTNNMFQLKEIKFNTAGIENNFGINIKSMMKYGDIVATFENQSDITLYRFHQETLDIRKMYLLPLFQFKINMNKFDYKFVINEFNNKIVFAQYNQYLAILFHRQNIIGQQLNGQTIIIYDISRSHQDSLQYKRNFNIENLDTRHCKIEIINSGEQIDRILFTQNQKEIQVFKINNQISLAVENQQNLLQKCEASNQFDLSYEIYPGTHNQLREQFEREGINLTKQIMKVNINAFNNGLVIQRKQPEFDFTIAQITGELTYLPDAITQSYLGLKNLFTGQGINYNFKQLNLNEKVDVKLMHTQQIYELPVVFLNKQINLKAYLILSPYQLFFDNLKIFIKSVDNDIDDDHRPIENIFNKETDDTFSNKTFYHITSYDVDIQEGQNVRIMVTQNTLGHIRLSLIKTIDKKLVPECKNCFGKDPSKHVQIIEARESIRQPWQILYSSLYIKGQPKLNQKGEKEYNFLGIFTFDSTLNNFDDEWSVIYMYNITLIEKSDLTLEMKVTLNNGKPFSITPNVMQLHYFKVSSVYADNSNGMLIIGIKDYGLMIYDMDTHSLKNLESMQSYLRYDKFEITGVIGDIQDSYHVIVNNAIVVNYRSQHPQKFSMYFKQDEDEYIEKKSLARQLNSNGYAFIQRTYNESSERYFENIKVFDLNAEKHSILAAQLQLVQNEECHYLQSVPLDMVTLYQNKIEVSEISNTTSIYSVICGTSEKVILVDLNPMIKLSLNQNSEISNLQLEVTAYNEFVVRNVTTKINIVLLNSEMKTLSQHMVVMFGLTIISIALVIMIESNGLVKK